MPSRRCGLVTLNSKQSFYCDLLPSNEGRSSMVHSLIRGFEVQVEKIPFDESTVSMEQLCRFHDLKYVRFLMQKRVDVDQEAYAEFKAVNQIRGSDEEEDDDDETSSEEDEDDVDGYQDEHEILAQRKELGLLYDCPVFPFMRQYVKTVVAGTLAAAQWLIDRQLEEGDSDRCIAINWDGGRHHAHRSKAAGFCYVNDIVLGITHLRKTFPKIMYVDFDLHHGDGVAEAFKISNRVLTVSIHRKELGFYPGTGELKKDRGLFKGEGYDVNIDTKKGFSNKMLLTVVKEILIPLAKERFKPDCIVVQCGADGLNTDPHKQWNLTIKGFGAAIQMFLQGTSDIPVLMLGGGGYNHAEVSKCWSYLTAIAATGDVPNWDTIPLDTEHMENYTSVNFWSEERERNMKDENDDDMQWINLLKQEVLTRDFYI